MRFEKWTADRFGSPHQQKQKQQREKPSSPTSSSDPAVVVLKKEDLRSHSEIVRDLLSFPPSKISCVRAPKLIEQLETAQEIRSEKWFRLLNVKKSLVLQAAELQKLLKNDDTVNSSYSVEKENGAAATGVLFPATSKENMHEQQEQNPTGTAGRVSSASFNKNKRTSTFDRPPSSPKRATSSSNNNANNNAQSKSNQHNHLDDPGRNDDDVIATTENNNNQRQTRQQRLNNLREKRQESMDEIRRLRSECEILHNQVHTQDSLIKKLRNELEIMAADAVNITESEKDTRKLGGTNNANTFLTETSNTQQHQKPSPLPLGRRLTQTIGNDSNGTSSKSPESKIFNQTMSQVIEQASNYNKNKATNRQQQQQQNQIHLAAPSQSALVGRRQIILRTAKPKRNDDDDSSSNSDNDEDGNKKKKAERKRSTYDLGAVASLAAARLSRRKENNGLDDVDDDTLLLAASQNQLHRATSGEFAPTGSFTLQKSMSALERHRSHHNIQQQGGAASSSSGSFSGGPVSTMVKIPLQDFLFMCIKGAATLQVRPDAIRAAELIIKVQAKFRQKRIQKKFFMLRRLRKLFDRDSVSRCFYAWRNETQATQSANRFALRRSFRGWNSVVSESVMKKQTFGFIWRGLRDHATIQRVFKCWWRYIRYLNTKSDPTLGGVRRIAFTEGKNNHIDAWDEFLRKEDERRKLAKARSGVMNFLSFKKKRTDVDEETENWLCEKKHWDIWQEFVEDARKVVQQELMAEDFIKRRTLRKHFSAWEQLAAFTHQAQRRDFATKVYRWTRWKRFVMQEKLEREGVRDFKRVHQLQHLTKWRRRALEARRKTAAHTAVLQNNRKLSLMVAYAWKGMTTHLSYIECWKEWLDYTNRRRTWKAFVSSRVAVHNHFLKGAVFAAWVLETDALAQKFVMSKQHRDTNTNLIAGEERLSDFTEELKSLQFRVRASGMMRRVMAIERNARGQLAHFSETITTFRNDEMKKKTQDANNKSKDSLLTGGSGSVAEQIIASARSARGNSNNNSTTETRNNNNTGVDEENHNSNALVPTTASADSIAMLSKRQQRRMENVMQTCIATARSGTAFMNPFEHHSEMWPSQEMHIEKRHIERNFDWWLNESGVDRSLSFAVMHLLVDYVYREWILPRKRQRAAAQRMVRQSQNNNNNNEYHHSSSAIPSPMLSQASTIGSASPGGASISGASATSMAITVGERKQMIAQQQQNVARRMTFAIGVVSSVGMPFIQLGPNQKGAFMSIGNLEQFITSQSRTIQTRRIKEERNHSRRLRKFLQKQAALKLFQVSHTFSVAGLRNVVTPYQMVLESAKKIGKKRVVPLPKQISKAKSEIFTLRRRLLPNPDGSDDDDQNSNNNNNNNEPNSLIGTRGNVHCDFHKFVELQVARGCALRDLANLGVNTTMYGFTSLKQEQMQKREYQLSSIPPLETEVSLSTDRIKKRIHDVAPRPIVNPITVDFRLLEVVGFNPKVFNLRSLLRLRERMRVAEEEKQAVYAKAEAAIAARANRENVDDIFKKDDSNKGKADSTGGKGGSSHLEQLGLMSAHSFSAFSFKTAQTQGSFLGSRHAGARESGVRDFKKFMANRRFNQENLDDAADDFHAPLVASPTTIFGADSGVDLRSPHGRSSLGSTIGGGGRRFGNSQQGGNNKRGVFLMRRRSGRRKSATAIDPETGEVLKTIQGVGADQLMRSDNDEDEEEYLDDEEIERRLAEEAYENQPPWTKIDAENDASVVFDDYQRMAPKTWRVGALSLQKRNQIRKDEFIHQQQGSDQEDDDDDDDFYASAASAKTAIENLDFVDRWIEDPDEDEIEEIIARQKAGMDDDDEDGDGTADGHPYHSSSSIKGGHHHHGHLHHHLKKGQTVLHAAKIHAPYFKRIRERLIFEEKNVFIPPLPAALRQKQQQQKKDANNKDGVSSRGDGNVPLFDEEAFSAIDRLLKDKAKKEEAKKFIKAIAEGEEKLLKEHKRFYENNISDENLERTRFEREEFKMRGFSRNITEKRLKSEVEKLLEEKEPNHRHKVQKTEEAARDHILAIEEEFRGERLRLEQQEKDGFISSDGTDNNNNNRPGSAASSLHHHHLRPMSSATTTSAGGGTTNTTSRRSGRSSSASHRSSSSRKTITTIDENGNQIEVEVYSDEEEDEEELEEFIDENGVRRSRPASSTKISSRISSAQPHHRRPGSSSRVSQYSSHRSGTSSSRHSTNERGENDDEEEEEEEEYDHEDAGRGSRPHSSVSSRKTRPTSGGSVVHHQQDDEEEEFYDEEELEEYEEYEEVEVTNEDGSVTTTRSVIKSTRRTGRSSRSSRSNKRRASAASKIPSTARTATISTVSDNDGATARERRRKRFLGDGLSSSDEEDEAAKNKRKRKQQISFLLSGDGDKNDNNDQDSNQNIASKILRHASNVRGAFSGDSISGDFSIGSGIGGDSSDSDENDNNKKGKKKKKKIHRISYANAAKALENFQKEMRELLPQRVIAPRPQQIVVFDEDDYTTDEDDEIFDEDDDRDITVSAREKRKKLRVLSQNKEKKRKYKPHILAEQLVQMPDPRVFVDRPKNDLNSGRMKRTNALLDIQKERIRMMSGVGGGKDNNNKNHHLTIASPINIPGLNTSSVRKLSRKEEDELFAVFEQNPETGILEPRKRAHQNQQNNINNKTAAAEESNNTHHKRPSSPSDKQHASVSPARSTTTPVDLQSHHRQNQDTSHYSPSFPPSSSPNNNNKKLVRATQIALELEGRRTIYASYAAGTLIHDINEDVHRFFEADKARRKELKRQAKIDQEKRREQRKTHPQSKHQEEGEDGDDQKSTTSGKSVSSASLSVSASSSAPKLLNYQPTPRVNQHDDDDGKDDEDFFNDDSQSTSNANLPTMVPDDYNINVASNKNTAVATISIPKLLETSGRRSATQQAYDADDSNFSSEPTSTTRTTNTINNNNPTTTSNISARPASAQTTTSGRSLVQQYTNNNNQATSLPPRPPSAPSPQSAQRNNRSGGITMKNKIHESFLTTPEDVQKEQQTTSGNNSPRSSAAATPRSGRKFSQQMDDFDNYNQASAADRNMMRLTERDITVIRTLERRNFQRQMGQPFLTSLTKSILSPKTNQHQNQQHSTTGSLLGNRRLQEQNMFSISDNRGLTIDVPRMYTGDDDDDDDDDDDNDNNKHEDEEIEETYEEEVEVSSDEEKEEDKTDEKNLDDEKTENKPIENQTKQKRTKILTKTRSVVKKTKVVESRRLGTDDEVKRLLGHQYYRQNHEEPQKVKVRENLEKMMSTANLINRHLASMK